MILGYILATLIGLSLGLLGGGGSILTVPILVYVLKMDPKISIALSLAIVGTTSLFGVFGHYKNENVDLRIASVFAPVAMGGTFLGAKLSQFVSGQIQLLMFAIIMIVASFFMLKGRKENKDEDDCIDKKKLNYLLIGLEGLVVGVVTGLVGVGGGFLIVPALVLLGGVSMKKAVGTSLLIISLKSFAGFFGYIGIVEIPWMFLSKFTFFSIIGIFVGSYLVRFVSQSSLKKVFAIFLIIMGFFILYKNKNTFIVSSINSTHLQKVLS